MPTQELSVTSLIQDTLGQVAGLKSSSVICISVKETAAEKWVGLTRRIAASERGYYAEDTTLIRYVYDLSAIYAAGGIDDKFFSITESIVNNDAKQFKNQYPEYFANPVQEIQHSIAILKNNPEWENRYHNFIDTMVYDKDATHNYRSAVTLLEEISDKVINTLHVSV